MIKSFVRHVKDEGYSVDRRWEHYKFHIYTSDIKLLDKILGDEQLRPLLKDIEYTSEQYDRDINKERIVHTDILIKRNVDDFCYKVMLKQNWGDPARKADTLSLLELCEANLNNILWGGLETQDRMRSGSLWDNQHCVYTNDENLVTMMWLVAKPAIHKVYKIVQKEK